MTAIDETTDVDDTSTMTPKAAALRVLNRIADDATVEEILHAIKFCSMIDQGIRQVDAGLGISDEDARKRFAKWLS